MGRPHSSEHFQAVVDEWRQKLLAVGWEAFAKGGDGRLLAVTLEVNWSAADGVLRKRLKAAASALATAMAIARDDASRPDDLDDWIARHLVRVGAELLITDALRAAALGRARDAGRRRVHGEAGLRSARVEMPEDSWVKLRAIRAGLAGEGGAQVSLGEALGIAIAAYGQQRKPVALQPKRVRKHSKGDREDDLFNRPGAMGGPEGRGA